MIDIKNEEEKQKIGEELKALVKRVNEIIACAPLDLYIRFNQNMGGTARTNADLQVWISETVSY